MADEEEQQNNEPVDDNIDVGSTFFFKERKKIDDKE